MAKEESMCGYFMQAGATAHTANYSINVLNKVSEDRLISCRLWPGTPSDLNPCDFDLRGNIKTKMYSNNPHALDELMYNICETIISINTSETSVNLFQRLEGCLTAEERHFEHLL
jgi:hypothetical protein